MIENPIILFDGVCNLCNNTVDFVIRKDKHKQFRFVALQSAAGEKLSENFNIPPETDSVILLDKNQVYFESDAVLKIAGLMGFPWNLPLVFKIIPQNTRDAVYKWIAKNRYKWFGKRNTCRLPTPEEKIYFPEPEDLKI